MVTEYFMRVRGRVLGPFDCEKLQALSRRGQLSRMHEISTDGVNWSRASIYPELFQVASDPAANGGANETKSPQATTQPDPPQSPPATMWHFTLNGQEQTPVEFRTLQAYAAGGQLRPDDQVWCTGMTAWVAAREINGLVFAIQHPPISSGPVIAQGAGSAVELDSGLCRSAQSSRSWVLFLIVVGFAFAALYTVVGVISLIFGGRAGALGSPFVLSGVCQLILAVVFAVGSFLLLTYANRLNGLSYAKQPLMLEKALDSLRAFWVYVSIVVIVFLAIAAIFFSLVMASAVALPRLSGY